MAGGFGFGCVGRAGRFSFDRILLDHFGLSAGFLFPAIIWTLRALDLLLLSY